MKACAQALAQTDYVSDAQVVSMELGTGSVQLEMRIPQEIFYQIAGEQSGLPIRGEADLIPLLTKLAAIQKEYQRFDGALQQVQQTVTASSCRPSTNSSWMSRKLCGRAADTACA